MTKILLSSLFNFHLRTLRCAHIISVIFFALSSYIGHATSDETRLEASESYRAIRIGHLDNGLTFILVQRNHTGTDVAVQMSVAGGFISEARPGQRGFTHLIEHLAFDTTKGFPFGELQTFGLPLTKPAPSAAFNDWRQTSYYFETRSGSFSEIDGVLHILRQFASEISFDDEALARQVADVSHEMQNKKTGNKLYGDLVASIAPGSANDVLNYQDHSDINNATAADLQTLYRKIYQPNNTVLTVVGRFDFDQIENAIRAKFQGWKSAQIGPPEVFVPSIEYHRVKQFVVDNDITERSGTVLSLTANAVPFSEQQDEFIKARAHDLLLGALIRFFASKSSNLERSHWRFSVNHGDLGYRNILLVYAADHQKSFDAISPFQKILCELDGLATLPSADWVDLKEKAIASHMSTMERHHRLGNVAMAQALSSDYLFGGSFLLDQNSSASLVSYLNSLTLRQFERILMVEYPAVGRVIRVEGNFELPVELEVSADASTCPLGL